MLSLSFFRHSGCLLLLASSLSVTADEGNLIMKGTIVKKGCTVESESKSQTVVLGKIATKSFHNTSGVRTNPKPFVISLVNCSSPSVSLIFSGSEYLNSGLLLLSDNDGAQGVAVELSDDKKDFIPLNKKITPEFPDADKNLKFIFHASYMSTSGNITAGSANAESVFSLIYE